MFTALGCWDCENEMGGERRGGMWPPSDPEIMLSASSNKGEITSCSVWPVAVVSASRLIEDSKENAHI